MLDRGGAVYYNNCKVIVLYYKSGSVKTTKYA
jgi:hypothetical protein